MSNKSKPDDGIALSFKTKDGPTVFAEVHQPELRAEEDAIFLAIEHGAKVCASVFLTKEEAAMLIASLAAALSQV